MSICPSAIDRLRTPKSRLSEVEKRHWSLAGLSDDVLCRIYSFLGPADRVSFALSSRRLHAVVLKPGERFMVCRDDRIEILQRFERDGVYPTSILCMLCESFHRPRLTYEWDAEEAARACVRSGDDKLYGKTTCELFPTSVHFDIVAAITRSWRHNLGFYSPPLLEYTELIFHQGVKGDVYCHAEAKVVDGRLILKTEKVLFTGYRRTEGLKGLTNLARLMEGDDGLGYCCPHVQWSDICPFVLTPDQADYIESQKLHCLWSHRNTRCLSRVPQLPEVCRGKANLKLRTRHCRHCYTNLAISFVYIKHEDVKLVTLTTWKDLGRGISIEDPAWKSHTTFSDSTTYERAPGTLSLYHLFEGEGGRKAPSPYVPNLEGQVLSDLLDLINNPSSLLRNFPDIDLGDRGFQIDVPHHGPNQPYQGAMT